MAIPTITSYTMPLRTDLPENKVNWKADPSRMVLLIHDMQQYFIEAYQGDSPVTELVEHIHWLRKTAHQLSIPVIYTAQPGGQTQEERGLLLDFWGNGIGDDPEEQRIIPSLAPAEQDMLLTKWRYSAFQKTDLLSIIRSTGRDQIMICGIYAHIGCMLTAAEAFMQEIQPFFVADALADFSKDYHLQALKYASERCAYTLTTAEIVAQLNFESTATTEIDDEKVHPIVTPESLRTVIANLLYMPETEISVDEDVTMLGLDSIRIMNLVEQWRAQGKDINFIDLLEKPTLLDWCDLLNADSNGQDQSRVTIIPSADVNPPNLDYLLK
ncbi:isochorismatase family protein [Paenibacillus sp. Marseille-Q4541]|uniref:isochorismatase family protein n=1 Tax=Paenibacillus sp. Marseille-Q4541 TaxID=2831522 RepID=UPI001BA486FB|nr:isochorismatase family protein [Paenibacillus sp. Marseille-Q4541]